MVLKVGRKGLELRQATLNRVFVLGRDLGVNIEFTQAKKEGVDLDNLTTMQEISASQDPMAALASVLPQV